MVCRSNNGFQAMPTFDTNVKFWHALKKARTPGLIIAKDRSLRIGDYWLYGFEQAEDAEYLAQAVLVADLLYEALQESEAQARKLQGDTGSRSARHSSPDHR